MPIDLAELWKGMEPWQRGALVGAGVGGSGLGVINALSADKEKSKLRRGLEGALVGLPLGAGLGALAPAAGKAFEAKPAPGAPDPLPGPSVAPGAPSAPFYQSARDALPDVVGMTGTANRAIDSALQTGGEAAGGALRSVLNAVNPVPEAHRHPAGILGGLAGGLGGLTGGIFAGEGARGLVIRNWQNALARSGSADLARWHNILVPPKQFSAALSSPPGVNVPVQLRSGGSSPWLPYPYQSSGPLLRGLLNSTPRTIHRFPRFNAGAARYGLPLLLSYLGAAGGSRIPPDQGP